MASRMAQRSKALHRSAIGITTDPGLLLVATGRPMRRHTIGPALSWLGEGLAGRDVLDPSCSSNSLWRDGCMDADFGQQLYGISSKTLVWLASGLSVSRRRAAWQVRVSEDAWLSTFTSPESVRELQRWDKTNYQLDVTKLGRKT